MVTEEEIKKLAYLIWELERCPNGRDWDHYFRAKRLLDNRERVLSNMNRIQMSTPFHSERAVNCAEIGRHN
jgi:hypothetical protein